jgi:hypothetical protein
VPTRFGGMTDRESARDWAEEIFGHADLGDSRRTRRLVRIAADAAERPGGKVLEVCRTSATRQGAYDFLSNGSVSPEAVQRAVTKATTLACGGSTFCFVAIDGTALSLTDWQRRKDFGAVGTTHNGARGLKVVNAFAVAEDGTPIGMLGQKWWRREAHKRRRDCRHRTVDEKETQYWLSAIRESAFCLSGVGTRAWFQLDREGDRYATLKTLHESGQWFTVRSSWSERYLAGRKRSIRLRHAVAKSKVRGGFLLQVPTKYDRPGRVAKMLIRTASVVLEMHEPATGNRFHLPVNVVDARESRTTPRGAKPIHWRLLTNRPIDTDKDVENVLRGYTQRWKIEELHRTWKSGACRVEESQLRTTNGVMKWAIIMVATASRIERIKHLHRTSPESDASSEFSHWEIAAAVLMKRRYRRRNEPEPNPNPSVGEIVVWLAELGGYTGKSSGGPPGSITIRRGLESVAPVAAALEQLADDSKM